MEMYQNVYSFFISDSSWTSRADASNSISRNAATSTVSMCSPPPTWSSGQITLDSLKPTTSCSSMSHSPTNPISFILSVDQRDEKELDYHRFLPPASISTLNPNLSLPVDLNWIGPSDYPAHLSPTLIRDTPFTCVELPDLKESVTKLFIQPTREAEMQECHSAPEQVTKNIFIEEYSHEQTPDSSDCRPPLKSVDSFPKKDGEISNKHASFSYFPEKPRMPNTKFQPFVSFRCPFGFRMTPPVNQTLVCDNTCSDDSKFGPPCLRLSSSTQLTQDVHETDPSFVDIDPIASPFLVSPRCKSSIVTKKKSVKPYFRSGRPRNTNLSNPNPSWYDKSTKGCSIKRRTSSKTKNDPLCVQSLVTKFIHAAKNKQLSYFNAQESLVKMQRNTIPIAERTTLPQSRESTARHQAKKQVIETIVLDQSLRKSKILTPQSPAVSENVQLPQHDLSVLMKPEIKVSRSQVVDSDVTHLVSIAPLKPPRIAPTEFPLRRRSKPPVPKSKVDIDVSDEGNFFVTIRLIASSSSNKSNKIHSRKKVNCKDKRISTNQTGRPGKATCNPPLSKSKSGIPFHVQSLATKFIQAAKNKIIP